MAVIATVTSKPRLPDSAFNDRQYTLRILDERWAFFNSQKGDIEAAKDLLAYAPFALAPDANWDYDPQTRTVTAWVEPVEPPMNEWDDVKILTT